MFKDKLVKNHIFLILSFFLIKLIIEIILNKIEIENNIIVEFSSFILGKNNANAKITKKWERYVMLIIIYKYNLF